MEQMKMEYVRLNQYILIVLALDLTKIWELSIKRLTTPRRAKGRKAMSEDVKRPEKKEYNYDDEPIDYEVGYNQACDDWEAYHSWVVKEIYKQFGVDLDEDSPYTEFDGESITIRKDMNE